MRFDFLNEVPSFAGNEPVDERVVTILVCPRPSERRG
jgi:hypothetical protein